MNFRPVIYALGCAIVIVVTVYFGGKYLLKHQRPEITPATSTKKPTTLLVEDSVDEETRNLEQPKAKGYWHGDVWHTDGTHTTPTQTPKPKGQPNEEKSGRFSDLPPEIQVKTWVEFYRQRGVDGPPPEGYHYVWINGKAERDENGDPILLREGELYFQVSICNGFRPTPEQYEQYQQLKQDYEEAYMQGHMDEFKQIGAELKKFREEHLGELPSITTLSQKGYDRSDPRHSERRTELLAELYRKAGLDYLIPELY